MGVGVWLSGALPVLAADAPAFVIPGKAGVPVIINGYDASYSVVEGDWGLDRPGAVPPTIISGPLIGPAPAAYGRGYYPAYGERPGYGRLEIEPPANRRLPPPAPSFHRSWSSQSDSTPATVEPDVRPPLIVAPQINGRRQTLRRSPPPTPGFRGEADVPGRDP
jgi:hypothetical protein